MLVLLTALVAVAPATAASPVQQENALPGSVLWQRPAAPRGAIEGYASATSVGPGEEVDLHVSTAPAARYRVELFRLGWYGGLGGRVVACVPSCAGDEQGSALPVPLPDAASGLAAAGWPVTDRLVAGDDWTSGYYDAKLVLTSGVQAGAASDVVFVVRAPVARVAPILVQVPVNTWNAYDNWGGRSLYAFNSDAAGPATRVSFDRPQAGVPALLWEIQLVRFLEREGLDVSYQTDVDTALDPGGLLRHAVVLTAGHGEYWTREIRDGLEAARDAGVSLGFLGANTGYWQVRYEDGGRTMVSYKSLDDPVADPAAKTTLFRALNRWECGLLGVQSAGGLQRPGAPPVDYAVVDAGDRWLAGSGLANGAVLSDLAGGEWDELAPEPAPPPCVKPRLRVLLRGTTEAAVAIRYVAPSGARVFSAGSLHFSWGLDGFGSGTPGHAAVPSAGVQQLLRNALADMVRPPRPLAIRAAVSGGRVVVAAAAAPAVTSLRIVRQAGGRPLGPADASAAVVCELAGSAGACVDPGARRGRRYRYDAVSVSAWGVSEPAQTPVLAVP